LSAECSNDVVEQHRPRSAPAHRTTQRHAAHEYLLADFSVHVALHEHRNSMSGALASAQILFVATNKS
jgi:hypothetical protein